MHNAADTASPRARWIPATVSYAPQLPVSEKAEEIAQLIRDKQVVIVAGDTGSGKTTQLPKICLAAGLGRRGLIGHTQPRRLAALSVAERIAEELGPEAGRGVGSQIRFDDRSGPETFLKLMTDGILLAEIQADPSLSKYEAIIIDEAHERSLNIDFLLGFLRQLLDRRDDLKLIITSATIDVEKFSAHFDSAPIVSVEGRTYPVEVLYRPMENEESSERGEDPQSEAIASAVKEILGLDRRSSQSSGDILVFLASEREIRESADFLRKAKLGDLDILPLYGRLQHAEQARIFAAHSKRRVVLATNVAETSITVPGINFVIDTGTARISRYSLQSKVQRLPIESVSQASANQRKGRCGRLANGVCIRLYSEQDFEARPAYTDPEIRRTNLASVILRMLALRLGAVEDFPFLEMPELKAINEGYKLLLELNAITANRQLTKIGRQMAGLPIDPRYARMLIEASRLGCVGEVLIIVSGLTIQDPRESHSDNRQAASEKHAQYRHPESDFMSLLSLWESYEALRQSSSQSVLRKYCKKQLLSFMRLREWREVHRQLLLSCQKLGFNSRQGEADYASIHKSLIAGSLNQIARRVDNRTFLGTRNKKFSLFGSSVLARSGAQWIMTGEQIETSQVFATQAAKIQPEWVEEVAVHLVKRESFDPHWSRRRQEVMCYEKVHLFGLTLVERALVRFAPIDPAGARGLFIRHALVPGEAARDLRFNRENRLLIEKLEKLEDKLRRPDLLLGEQQQIQFFERVLPADVHSSKSLKTWLARIGDRHGDVLRLTEAELLGSRELGDALTAYPDAAAIHSNALRIDYVFDPGKERDGATLEVPIALLAQLTPADIDWALPGILREKCTALLKGLPKAQRKNFIPVSGFVEEIMPLLKPSSRDLLETLCEAIFSLRGIRLAREAFEAVDLLPHLRIKIKVLGSDGAELALDSSLVALKNKFASVISPSDLRAESSRGAGAETEAAHPLEVVGLTTMPEEPLPDSLEVGEGAIKLLRYPSLVDAGDGVSVRLLADRDHAKQSHGAGILRLALINSVQQRNALRKLFSRFAKDHALHIPLTGENFEEQALEACYLDALGENCHSIRSRQQFEERMGSAKAKLMGNGDRLVALLEKLLVTRLTIRRRLAELSSSQGLQSPSPRYVLQDVEAQLNELFAPTFLRASGLPQLAEYPRYLEAIRLRLSKAPHMGARDEVDTQLLAAYAKRLATLSERRGGAKADVAGLRWVLQEFRVSLFAQSLRTKIPVSPQRVEKAFLAVEKGVD